MNKHDLSTRRTALGLATSTFVALLLAGCGGSLDDDGAPTVATTANGRVAAVERSGYRSYFAIPYAAPPVGNLRWQPPAAPANWSTTRSNSQSPAPCLQTSASPFALPGGQEDCLYLDVHAPKGNGPFPVMVWIHGGAFNTGGAVTYQSPTPLVSKGVVVVAINYRLGPLGFLGDATLENASGGVGNYGVMDQQAALRWVKANIAAFGGDPANVTIFGESAGGFSVLTHLASPLSKGLFHKAIVESGAYAVNSQLTKAALETGSRTIVTNALGAAARAGVALPAGCTSSSATAACLRALPASVIQNQLAPAFNAVYSSPTPSVDGEVLPQSVRATFSAGQNNAVPLINGSNQDEWSLFLAITELAGGAPLTAAGYPSYLATGLGLGTQASGIAAAYPLASYGSNAAQQPSLAATAVGTDLIFACNAFNVSKRVQAQGQPIYMYEFRDQTAYATIGSNVNTGTNSTSFPQGAAHSYEIQYLFDFAGYPARSAEQQALSEAMATYWTNFAKGGDPNSGRAVATPWTRFTGSNVLGLDVAGGGGAAMFTTFATDHKCTTTWASLAF